MYTNDFLTGICITNYFHQQTILPNIIRRGRGLKGPQGNVPLVKTE